ncbi:ABC transporter substrate-binding protein [Lacisediminihabitans sp.]|jgi:NitT/TauT family transport system substrate-binding protein|uniref:ABC transporter substrate-binding protein n=1 Tax=Lacisediminihabitans sp. TaxID=2787631 RepID=UPI002F92311C
MKENPNTKRRMLVLASAAIAVAIGVAGCSSATTATAPKAGATSDSANGNVAIMVGGLNKQIYLPFMLAQQLGYYKQQGLTVTLSDEPAGVDATTNMLAGKVDGVGGFYDHTIDLAGLGQQVESVVNMLVTPGEVELCRSDLKGQIKSPADWSGRNLGITDLGSSTDFLTQYLAKKNGVDPTTIHRLGVQSGATLIGAMQHKNVDCAMTTEPTVSQLMATGGAYILLDMRSSKGTSAALGGEYPATSLYMKSSWVKQNPVTVQKLVNAYVKTLKYIQANDGATIVEKIPADYYAGAGKAAWIKAFDSEKGIYNPTGIMPPNGPPTNLKVLSAFNKDVQGKSIDIHQTYTDKFVTAAK